MNRFRRIRGLSGQPAQAPVGDAVEHPDLGFRGDLSPRVMDLRMSPSLSDIRFESGAIRKDFGWSSVGSAGATAVQALAEYKYVDGSFVNYSRLIRVRRVSGNARIEIWDGANWVQPAGLATHAIGGEYLSVASMLNRFVLTGGSKLLTYYERIVDVDYSHDFPSGNSLTAIGVSTSLNVTPGGSTKFTVSYDLSYDQAQLSALSGDSSILRVVFKVNGVVQAWEDYTHVGEVAAQTFTYNNEQKEVSYALADGDTVAIEIATISDSMSNVSLHGHNKTTDGDLYSGVSYVVETDTYDPTLERLGDAPSGTFVLPFGDRLLALQADGDPQAVAWSADGDIEDWTGGDSNVSALLDTRADGIDALMAASTLGGQTGALFRQRSIMRFFETGNTALAVGFVHRIDNLGTESPFSVQDVPGGAIFLGHDLQVYYITESSLTSIGGPIHKELVENVTDHLDKVDSAYDTAFGEYYLGVPIGGATTISKVWIFDFQRFRERQEIVWRSRSMTIERFGTASVIA